MRSRNRRKKKEKRREERKQHDSVEEEEEQQAGKRKARQKKGEKISSPTFDLYISSLVDSEEEDTAQDELLPKNKR